MSERLTALAATAAVAVGGGAMEAPNAFAAETHDPNNTVAAQPYAHQDLAGGALSVRAVRGADGKFSLSANPTATEASTGYLNDVGPALPDNLNNARRELKTELREEGPNSGLAREIAEGLHISTAAGRAEYITPNNISLGEKIIATNTEYPGDVGLTGETPVSITNPHPSSVAYTIVAKNLPEHSRDWTRRLKNGEYQVNGEVIRGLCVNALFKAHLHRTPQKHFSNRLSVDVTFGVLNKVSAFAESTSQSSSSSGATATCPDGSVVSASSQSSAEAAAIAEALADIKEHDKFVIEGKGLTYAQFQAQFNADVKVAEEAITNAASNSSSSASIECPPVAPTPPSSTPNCTNTPSLPGCTPPEQETPTESITNTELSTVEPLSPNGTEQLCVDAEQVNTDASGNQTTSVPIVTFEVESGSEGTVSSTYDDQDGNPNHVCAIYQSGSDYGQAYVDAIASSNDGGTEPPVKQQFDLAIMQDTGFANLKQGTGEVSNEIRH